MDNVLGFFGLNSNKKRPRVESEDESETASTSIELDSPINITDNKTATPIKAVESQKLSTPMKGKSPAKSSGKSILSEYRVPIGNVNIFEERVTLAQKLAKAVPDADINSPHVVVVGSQTAGKTRLIISLVFYHLIDNEHFSDDMGEQLLKIFRTGTHMITRRPTTINLSKNNVCKMTINLGVEAAVYPEPKFFEIIRHIYDQSADTVGHAYEEELRVYISAPGLPNRTFTDLPGLITNDRQLTGSASNKSIAMLVADYMKNPTTTIVVVEPASVEDFETSQITPLLRNIRLHHRSDIFDNSVLVLSKCDKIRDGLEGDIVDKIDLSSRQLVQFPYRHVVGVINKIEGEVEMSSDDLRFAKFKEMFRSTKEYERHRFESFLNKDGTPLCVSSQCTTSAVFNKMEQISFNMVYKSIQDGILSLDAKIEEVEQEIKDTLAPPIEFYDQNNIVSDSGWVSSVSTTPRRLNNNSDGSSNNPPKIYTRMTFIDEFRINFSHYLEAEIEGLDVLNRQDKLSYISEEIAGGVWPVYKPNNLAISRLHKSGLDALERLYHGMIEEDLRDCVIIVLSNTAHDSTAVGSSQSSQTIVSTSCLSKTASPFHRIDRFPALCRKIKDFITIKVKESIKQAKQRVTSYLNHQWEYCAPAGISIDQLCDIFDALHNIAIRSVHRHITEVLSEKTCFGLENSLFVENSEFQAQRTRLQDRPFALRRQRDILTVCLGVTSNDELREALERSGATADSEMKQHQASNSTFTSPLKYNPDLRQYATDSSTLNATSSDILTSPQSSSIKQETSHSTPSTSNHKDHMHTTVQVDDHWREFWTNAAREAQVKAEALAEAILLEERRKQQQSLQQQTSVVDNDETQDMSYTYDQDYEGGGEYEEVEVPVVHSNGGGGSVNNSTIQNNNTLPSQSTGRGIDLSDEELLRGAIAAEASQGSLSSSQNAASYLGSPNIAPKHVYSMTPPTTTANVVFGANASVPFTSYNDISINKSVLSSTSNSFSAYQPGAYVHTSSSSSSQQDESNSNNNNSGSSSKRIKREVSESASSPMLNRIFNAVSGAVFGASNTTTASHNSPVVGFVDLTEENDADLR